MESPRNIQTKIKFIDSFSTFVVATACLGPFALPLLWRNPRYKIKTKILGTAVVTLFTIFLIWVVKVYLEPLLEQYKSLTGQP